MTAVMQDNPREPRVSFETVPNKIILGLKMQTNSIN